MMRSTSGLRALRWAAEYEVTAERAGVALLVLATAGLMAAFFLPWWSLAREDIVLVHPTVLNDCFSGWGWLSFAAGLVALALVVRLVIAKGISLGVHLDSRMLASTTVAAGLAELLGNMLFIAAAPKTEIFIGAGQGATRGVGLDIAYGGRDRAHRQWPAHVRFQQAALASRACRGRRSGRHCAPGHGHVGTVHCLFPSLVFLVGVFDTPPFPLGVERLLRLGMDELRRMAGDARRRGVALRGRAEGWGQSSPKVLSIS